MDIRKRTPYKLKPQIREFILQKAQEEPLLGCRKISRLINTRFAVYISKSSINALWKFEGLSKPIGRRRIHSLKTAKIQESKIPKLLEDLQPSLEHLTPIRAENKNTPNIGYWFFKAVDVYLGGIAHQLLEEHRGDVFYSLIFDNPADSENASYKKIVLSDEYLRQLYGRLKANLQEAAALRFILDDTTAFFIDANFHTVWPLNHIPKSFTSPVFALENKCKAIVEDNQMLILQAAPGFQSPHQAFTNFLEGFSQEAKKTIKQVELYSPANALIKSFQVAPEKKLSFIVGIWPWQYSAYSRLRQVPVIEKGGLRISLLTNLETSLSLDAQVIEFYQQRWPNWEDGYQVFLGTLNQAGSLPLAQHREIPGELNFEAILNFWLEAVTNYCQSRFFPLNCQELDLLGFKEYFYSLPGRIEESTDCLKVIFAPPTDFPYRGELSYACLRLNEADILENGKRVKLQF